MRHVFQDGSKNTCISSRKQRSIGSEKIQGLKIQGGGICFFVDSDDTINFDTISECVRLIEEENADLVMGGYSGIGEKGYLRWSIILKE